MKIATVNIIETTNGTIQGLTAFPETPEGNKAAEELFAQLLRGHNAEPDDVIERCIEDGTYSHSIDHEVLIVHST